MKTWTFKNKYFQENRRFLLSQRLHSGSLETTNGNNVIELNNFCEFGPTTSSGDFGSLDSSDTFLSCNTHPFPSQGSLVGLEALAAQGSMAPNGSINNSVYVNPFDPHRDQRRRRKAVTPSPKGSPQRRVRIAARSRSSDLCDLDLMDRETSVNEPPPKHKRARVAKVKLFIFSFNQLHLVFFNLFVNILQSSLKSKYFGIDPMFRLMDF